MNQHRARNSAVVVFLWPKQLLELGIIIIILHKRDQRFKKVSHVNCPREAGFRLLVSEAGLPSCELQDGHSPLCPGSAKWRGGKRLLPRHCLNRKSSACPQMWHWGQLASGLEDFQPIVQGVGVAAVVTEVMVWPRHPADSRARHGHLLVAAAAGHWAQSADCWSKAPQHSSPFLLQGHYVYPMQGRGLLLQSAACHWLPSGIMPVSPAWLAGN